MPCVTTSATAATTAALAVVVAVAAFGPPLLLALAVAVVGLLLAAGWAELLELPARRGSALVVALAALAAPAAALVGTHGTSLSLVRPDDAVGSGTLASLPGVAALALLVAFVHQLLRTDGRPRLVESVTGTVTGQACAVLAASWVVVPSTFAGPGLAVVVLAAVAAAALVCAGPWPLRVAGPLSLLAGAATGWLVSLLVDLAGAGVGTSQTDWTVTGVLTGLGAGLLTAGWRAHAARTPTGRTVQASLAVAAAPVALAGAGAYVVGRLVIG